MGIFDKLKRRKYFRYDLFINSDGVWKKFGDFKEFLDYKDIENPDPGCLLKFYGVSKDLSRKDGWARTSLWEHEVPMPGGAGGTVAGKGGKKETPIEERLMEKLIENADFSSLKPAKLSLPFGKSGGSLDFEAPIDGSGSGSSSGYVKMGDSLYPMGDLPPLEFEGKLPSWMHPAAGAMIMGIVDRLGSMVKGAIGGAITETTGIKAKSSTGVDDGTFDKGADSPYDAVSELDDILDDNVHIGNEDVKEMVVDDEKNVGKVKSKNKGKAGGGK